MRKELNKDSVVERSKLKRIFGGIFKEKKNLLFLFGFLSGFILALPAIVLGVGYTIGSWYFEFYHIPIVIISYVLSGLIPGILNPQKKGLSNLSAVVPLVFLLILCVLFHWWLNGWWGEEVELNVYLTTILVIPIMSVIGSLISPKKIKSVFEDKEKEVAVDTEES